MKDGLRADGRPSTVRIVATDLDGTLLRPDGSVSERTVRALADARDAGLTVVFVTGRPPRWLAPVVAATGHAGIAVCANGGLLVDLDADVVLATHPVPEDLVLDVAERLRAAVPAIVLGVELVPDGPLSDHRSFGHEPGYLGRLGHPLDVRVGPLAELVADRAVVKLLVRAPSPHTSDSFLALAQDLVGDTVEVTHSSHLDPLLEISAANVSKASTLAEHVAALGFGPDDVVCIGDMPNDVPMLQWATVSYAVEGAHPSAVAAAGSLLPPAEDDGVAHLLERTSAALRAEATPLQQISGTT